MREALPEGTYIELVKRLYATLLPTSIMALSFPAVGVLISLQTPDPLLSGLTIAGAVAGMARFVILAGRGQEARDPALDYAKALRLERIYATAYFLFALVFGLFSARAMLVASAEAHMLVVGLLFGYGAGVAAGLAMRPWISVPSILIATLPTMAVAAWAGRPAYLGVAVLLLLFLGGGIQAILTRYHYGSMGITMRRFFETLARSDALTGLANRLALREWVGRIAARDRGRIALHYLDLDKFKPVNDLHGHPVGDILLRMVADRLSGLLRTGDCAARMGGDEFVVVQSGTRHPSEADLLARRIVRAISQPYAIEGRTITIGTSVGYALSSECGSDLDRLIACADAALLRVKLGGGGIGAYHVAPAEAGRRMSA